MRWVWAVLLGVACAGASVALAAEAPSDPKAYFAAGVDALADGRFERAIDQLEAYADRAPPHPDASYNRGLAYAMRAEQEAEPGDLGRAAAAFEEALAMRPDDRAAARALEAVRAEVARRRSERGESSVIAEPSLDRLVVGLVTERTWGLAAIVASVLLAIGLVLRRAKEGSAHLTGVVLTPVAAVALLALTPLYLGARRLRLGTDPAVLVARQAFLSDETGGTRGGDPIPEAARLEVLERRGRRVRVRYGEREGWLPAQMVYVLRVGG